MRASERQNQGFSFNKTESDTMWIWYRSKRLYQDNPKLAWKEAWSSLRFSRNLPKVA